MSKMSELHADLERAAVLTADQPAPTLQLTRFEQIARAFPLHAQRIAELAHASGHGADLTEPSEGRWKNISTLFVFAETPEGHDYWWALAFGDGVPCR